MLRGFLVKESPRTIHNKGFGRFDKETQTMESKKMVVRRDRGLNLLLWLDFDALPLI